MLVMLFEGKRRSRTTFNVLAYSAIPYLVLSIVPFVGWLSIVYSFFLATIGLAATHRITKGKAFTAAFVPCLLFLGLAVLAVFALFAYISLVW